MCLRRQINTERRSTATTSSRKEFQTSITRTAKTCCLQLTRDSGTAWKRVRVWDNSGHFVKWEHRERFSGGLNGEMPRTGHRRRRGMDNGEGCPHPQPTSESELCQHGPGSELQPETNLVILLLRVLHWWQYNYVDDNEVHANRWRVSILVAKLFGQGRWRGRSCNKFRLVTVVWSPCKMWLFFLIFCARM